MAQHFSIQEAAQYLDVDYKVVYRLVREGKIPSTRIGWQFRITQADLNAYLNAERAKQESTAQQLRTQTQGAPVATAAADNGEGSARSPRAARTQASSPRTAGSVVEKSRARQMEQNFIGRFQKQIEEIESMRHPTTGVLIDMADWQVDTAVDEDREGLMRALNSAFLDRKTLATTPRNTHCRYTVNTDLPFTLEARFFAHLDALCQAGIDAAPAGPDDLDSIVQAYPQPHAAPELTVIVGIASPSGWNDAAIDALSDHGSQAPDARVHVLLVDLQTNQIHHSQHDTVAAGFAGLYESAIDLEDVAILREKLLAGLEGRSGLLLAEAARHWGVDMAILEDAANTLVEDGGVRLVPDKSNGWILVRA